MFGQRNENERTVRAAFVPGNSVTCDIYVGKLFFSIFLSPVAEQVTVGAVVVVVSVADLADLLDVTPRLLVEKNCLRLLAPLGCGIIIFARLRVRI